jgi:septum site-determining protein MinC
MMDDSLPIKGVRDSLLVTLPAQPTPQALKRLMGTVEQQAGFLKGARLALDAHKHELTAIELGQLRDRMADRDVTLVAVLSENEHTQEAAADLGLASNLDYGQEELEAHQPAYDTQLPGQEAVLVERTLRSGNFIQHSGHVIVLGDVNPGAQVTAGGNIIIWGRLRGVAHAGASGDEDAIVCALDLAPTQLRIGSLIALSPERKGPVKPEVARVRDGQIVAEPWD